MENIFTLFLSKLLPNARLLSLVLLGLASVGIVIFMASSQPSSETAVDQVQTSNGVEAELDVVRAVSDGFTVEYNYRSTSDNLVFQLGGASITTSDNSKVEATRGGLIGDEKWSDMVFMQPSSSVKEQPASISLGSFVVFDSSIGGSTLLDLGESYSSIIGSSQDENSSISLNQPLMIGDGRYNVSELIVDRESPRNNFFIVIVPENAAARKRELAFPSSVVTLTDDIPQQYKWIGTETQWSRNEDSIKWQHLSFDGFPSPNANQLNLSIQGVGALAGPIVFHNITLP